MDKNNFSGVDENSDLHINLDDIDMEETVQMDRVNESSKAKIAPQHLSRKERLKAFYGSLSKSTRIMMSLAIVVFLAAIIVLVVLLASGGGSSTEGSYLVGTADSLDGLTVDGAVFSEEAGSVTEYKLPDDEELVISNIKTFVDPGDSAKVDDVLMTFDQRIYDPDDTIDVPITTPVAGYVFSVEAAYINVRVDAHIEVALGSYVPTIFEHVVIYKDGIINKIGTVAEIDLLNNVAIIAGITAQELLSYEDGYTFAAHFYDNQTAGISPDSLNFIATTKDLEDTDTMTLYASTFSSTATVVADSVNVDIDTDNSQPGYSFVELDYSSVTVGVEIPSGGTLINAVYIAYTEEEQEVKASVDGIVKSVDEAGGVIEVENYENNGFTFTIGESYTESLAVGDTLDVSIDGKTISGSVVLLDTVNGISTVTLVNDEFNGFADGKTGKVTVKGSPVLVIPKNYVKNNAVLVVGEDENVETPVTLKTYDGDFYIVTDGLVEGDIIVPFS